jgi:hypothetical protein
VLQIGRAALPRPARGRQLNHEIATAPARCSRALAGRAGREEDRRASK